MDIADMYSKILGPLENIQKRCFRRKQDETKILNRSWNITGYPLLKD